MRLSTIIIVLLYSCAQAQDRYPFEEFPEIKYQEFKNWKVYEGREKIHFTLTVPCFFENKDTLTVQLTTFTSEVANSIVRIFRNKKQIQKIAEPMLFSVLNVPHIPLRAADLDGNKLNDVKIVIPYLGNGLAAFNQRIIYLFQTTDGLFKKISFMDNSISNRPERNFDGDQNYEIITMTLNYFRGHSYWTFDIYNYDDGKLKNQNQRFGYPIMISVSQQA